MAVATTAAVVPVVMLGVEVRVLEGCGGGYGGHRERNNEMGRISEHIDLNRSRGIVVLFLFCLGLLKPASSPCTKNALVARRRGTRRRRHEELSLLVVGQAPRCCCVFTVFCFRLHKLFCFLGTTQQKWAASVFVLGPSTPIQEM